MSGEYTPTTDEVREAYVVGVDPEVTARYRAEFNRWLERHDAELTEEVTARAIQAHRDLHPTYGSTAGCGGGIGGQVMTEHCAVVCDNPAHDAAKDAWNQIEIEHFKQAQARREQA